MYDALHPKVGGDHYGGPGGGMGHDPADPLMDGAGVDNGTFGKTEDWSGWPSNGVGGLGPMGNAEDADNTAYGRIEIPV